MANDSLADEFGFQSPVEKVQGQMAAESMKGVATVVAQVQSAKRFPRDENQTFKRLMTSCQRKKLAEGALYAYPKGGKTVSGPSIRLAEEAARCFQNLDYGITELESDKDSTLAQAYCYDLENNIRCQKTFRVQHKMKANNAYKTLSDPRDIYEHVHNMGARRLRACILGVIPGDIIEAAEKQCKKTLTGNIDEPRGDRIRKMVAAFSDIAISQELIEKRLKHPVSDMNDDELFEYRTVYQSIKDGMSKRSDFFALPKEEESSATESLLDETAETVDIKPKAAAHPVDNSVETVGTDTPKEPKPEEPKKEAPPVGNKID